MTGGVLSASIILVIVILTVGAIVLLHKHKEAALNQGMALYTNDYTNVIAI